MTDASPMPTQSPETAQKQSKKQWWKKWWVWLIVGVFVLGGIGSLLEGDPEPVAVADVVGLTGDEASDVLRDLGLEVDFEDATGEGRPVLSRSNWEVESTDPTAGESILQGETVTVYVTKISDREKAEKAAAEEAEKAAAEEAEKAAEEEAEKAAEEEAEKAKEETAQQSKDIEVLDLSADGDRFVSASFPVSDAFTRKGIIRNLHEGCVEAIQAVKEQTPNWWEFDTVQCMGMADWTDAAISVGSANFTGAQLAEVSDVEMTSNPEGFWNIAIRSNISPHL